MISYLQNPFYRYDYDKNKYVLIENGIAAMKAYYECLKHHEETFNMIGWSLDLYKLYITIEEDLTKRGLI